MTALNLELSHETFSSGLDRAIYIFNQIKNMKITGLFSGTVIAGSLSRFDGYVTNNYMYGEIRVNTYGAEERYSIFDGSVKAI